jgi:CDP-6-deoxy-D-xylo-4-hexulose-3-dehydrase
MQAYPQLRTQKEIGESSWFGFSMIVQPDAPFRRADVVRLFTQHGIDARPIVAGNFAKNEVLRWFDYEVHGKLANADDLDQNGLFIGNHHYALDEEFQTLRSALDELTGRG